MVAPYPIASDSDVESGEIEASTPRDNVDQIGTFSRAVEYLNEPVRPCGLVEFELLLLTFCTGIQDAISFPDYHCFASNQTGNTVFLMLAIMMPEFNGEMFFTSNIAAALGLFLAGGWITGQLSHLVGPRRRSWLVMTNLLQTGLVFGAAALQHVYGPKMEGDVGVAAVALLAFASGSQVVQSRSMSMTEISTAMATAAWVDLMIDPHMFQLKNRPRNRRIAFLVSLALGSLLGAAIYRYVGAAPALFISAAGKMVVTIMYLFNSKERTQKEFPKEAQDIKIKDEKKGQL